MRKPQMFYTIAQECYLCTQAAVSCQEEGPSRSSS